MNAKPVVIDSMSELEAEAPAVDAPAAEEKPKPAPKKVSARKVLKRQLESRYRFWTPAGWAKLKAKEHEQARLSREATDQR